MKIKLQSENIEIEVIFAPKNIKIINSYKIIKSKDMKACIDLIGREAVLSNFYWYKRSDKSWLREWKAHNLLYRLNCKRSSTKDTDLSEDESMFRRIGYFILSLFYWK